jgi:hypothetical protein
MGIDLRISIEKISVNGYVPPMDAFAAVFTALADELSIGR